MVGGSAHVLLGDDLSSYANTQVRRLTTTYYSRSRGFGVSGFKETYNVSLKISYLASGLAKFSYLHSDADLHL